MDDEVLPGMNKVPEEMAREIRLAADAGTGFSGSKPIENRRHISPGIVCLKKVLS